MHRDNKLGLALGILLVGTVGAFFFRNDSTHTALPELEDPAALDAQIRRQAGSQPYLTEAVPSEAAPALAGRDRIQNPHKQLQGMRPKPISTVSERTPQPVAPREEVKPAPLQAQQETPTRSESPSAVEYRVQPGDTLSKLSAHYLGTSQRFLEIFRANRDQLDSPNDLRAGMVIRIPTPQQPAREPTDNTTPKSKVLPAGDPHPVKPSPRTATRTSRDPKPGGTWIEPFEGDDPEVPPDGGIVIPAELPDGPRRFVPVPRTNFIRAPIEERASEEAGYSREASTRAHPENVHFPQSEARYYTVQFGDSLERIAVREYGRRSAAANIYAANQARLPHPNLLREGMRLVLP